MSKKRTKIEKRLERIIWYLARQESEAHRLLAEYVIQTRSGAPLSRPTSYGAWQLDWLIRVEQFVKENMVEANDSLSDL
jgi:hypothetical protein